MSIKSHIALGTLLGVLIGAGAVAVLSGASDDASIETGEAEERDRAAQDDVWPATAASVSDGFRRPMRPGARRRLLQS